jgi:NADH-quinone oxidoreductase subunit N
MMLLAAANSFMVLFIGLEILSLALYILSGFDRRSERSQEAGFKYFLLSSFASAFLIYGMALVYGATGTTRLNGVVRAVQGIAGTNIHSCLQGVGCSAIASLSPLLYVGIALMVVGFAFKVSIVPFHMWTPDVYEGAPTPITAFMSVATKAAMFAAFVRVFNLALSSVASHWFGIVWALAIATMIVGNIVALTQTNMKRLLAYSGIAHAGYILVALAANNRQGMTAVAFYFLAYTFMNIGAFIVVTVLESNGQVGDEIATYRGLWRRNPALAGFTAVFMFSLAGFPPSAGFFAKYLAFLAIVQAGHTELAIIGVLTSLVSIFYYLRVVVIMFMQPEEAEAREAPIPGMADIAMAAAVAGSIGLGVIPTGFFTLANQGVTAVRSAFGLG